MGFGNNYKIFNYNDEQDYIIKTYKLGDEEERIAKLEESIYNDIIYSKLLDNEVDYFLYFIEKPVISSNDIKLYYGFYDQLVKLDENNFNTLEEIFVNNQIKLYSKLEKFELIKNLIKCIEILHKYSIDHCNISPKNFIVYEKTKIKFIDFYLSCNYTQKSLINYIPPELITKLINRGNPVYNTQQSDIFILGLMMLEIIWGRHPFATFISPMNHRDLDLFYRNYLQDFVIDSTFSDESLEDIGNIIKNMLKISPNKRININNISNMFNEINNNSKNKQTGKGIGCNIPDDYNEEYTYGSGATAKVVAVHKKDNPEEKFVIKIFNKSGDIQDIINNEIQILKKIKYNGCEDNLLCYESDMKHNDCTYIVTKMFRKDSKSLNKYLEEIESKISTKNILKNKIKLIKNICNAINSLHKIKIIHGDIKQENILVDKNTLDIQIIDFGFAIDDDIVKIPHISGTPGYIPPEIINYMVNKNETIKEQLFSKIKLYKYDIFSLGMVFYEMINDISPLQLIKRNSLFSFFKYYQIVSKSLYPELDSIINKMTKYRVENRIDNFNKIINYLDNIDLSSIKTRNNLEMHIEKMIVETPLSDELIFEKDTKTFDKKFNYEMILDVNNKPMILGKGSFGITYLVSNKKTGKQYVSKVLKIGPRIKLSNIYNEIEILQKISKDGGCNKNLLCYVDYYFDELKSEMHIITDTFKNNQTLASLLDIMEIKQTYFTSGELLSIMKDLLIGLVYLHKHDIAHSDLKPDNILINNEKRIQIIDFGISCNKHCTKIENIEHLGDNEICKCLIGGTPTYMDPEIIRKMGNGYADINDLKRADIFSLGIVFYYLANFRLPYPLETKGKDNTQLVFLLGEFYNQNGYLTKSKRKEMLEMLDKDDPRRKVGVSKQIFKSNFKDNSVKNEINDKINSLIEKMLDINPDTRPLAKRCMSILNKIILEYNKVYNTQIISPGVLSP